MHPPGGVGAGNQCIHSTPTLCDDATPRETLCLTVVAINNEHFGRPTDSRSVILILKDPLTFISTKGNPSMQVFYY